MTEDERMEAQEERVDAVLEWAYEGGADFEPEFVESLKAQLEGGDALSRRQEETLENIIERWGITLE